MVSLYLKTARCGTEKTSQDFLEILKRTHLAGSHIQQHYIVLISYKWLGHLTMYTHCLKHCLTVFKNITMHVVHINENFFRMTLQTVSQKYPNDKILFEGITELITILLLK